VSQIIKRPAAEVVVDCETVRALLRTQHPDLSELPLEEVAAGWDNFIFRLGATMAVRLPRRLASVAAPADAPKNPSRGVPLQHRAKSVDERMDHLAQKTSLINPIVRKAWESALQASPAELATWIHGDLHPQNVLVKDGELSGVIDWADIAAGDSATDLATVWMLLPTVAARESAIEEYGSVPAATWSRALGWAINLGSLLLETGLAEDSRHAKIGELTLQRIVAGPHWT
jgi:aminoglycoside phosphotransferase (APT) family kinase protein